MQPKHLSTPTWLNRTSKGKGQGGSRGGWMTHPGPLPKAKGVNRLILSPCKVPHPAKSVLLLICRILVFGANQKACKATWSMAAFCLNMPACPPCYPCLCKGCTGVRGACAVSTLGLRPQLHWVSRAGLSMWSAETVATGSRRTGMPPYS